MELIERNPLLKIHYLNTLTFKEFKQLQIYKSSCKNEDERLIQFKIMKRFCETNIKTKGETKRIYSYTEKTPNEVGGRLYCGNSIQGISSKIRGFLMSDITTDIDMKNAHPVILRYLCKINNIQCLNLDYYIENRTQILERLGTDYKTEFLKCVNTDKTNKKIKDKFFKDFDRECKYIQEQLTAKECYEHIVKTVPSSREYNWMGSAINRILCVYENKILNEVISILNSRQIEICSLMFDGLMMYGNYYADDELLNEVKTKVNEKFDGLNIEFSYKSHSTELCLPEGFEIPKKKEVDGVYDDMAAAETVYELYPHWVCCNNVLYVFDDETGMWVNDKTSYNKIITRFTEKLYVLTAKENGEIVQSVKSYGNTLMLMEKIPVLIRTFCVDNNWIKNKSKSSLGKILFTNGYYDFHKEFFFDKETHGFNPDILFMGRIHYDFVTFDTHYMEDIKKRLFIDPLGEEMADFLILNLARGLAGDQMKRIMFGLGGTNGGKSLLTKVLELACGDYFGTFNAGNFAHKRESGDEAQALRWALLLRFKRLIFSNEIKSTTNLDGNLMKKPSSGGDSIVARCHGGNEEEFECHFLAMIFANDLPKIVPYDNAMADRTTVFSFSKTYVENPSNEFELKIDPNLKHEITTVEFQRAIIGLLIQAYMNKSKFAYIPDESIRSKEEWISSDKSLIDTFQHDFEITNDEKDFVQSRDIEMWIRNNNLGITMMKFSSEMKKYVAINKFEKVYNKIKKVNGKVPMCWFGVRMLIETSDDTENPEMKDT